MTARGLARAMSKSWKKHGRARRCETAGKEGLSKRRCHAAGSRVPRRCRLALLAVAALVMASAAVLQAGCQSTAESAGITQVRTVMASETQADAASAQPSLSADGRLIAFKSGASNLVLGAANGSSSIYVKDAGTGETTLISSDSAGVQGKGDSNNPAISSDGRFVAFESSAKNLVPGDTNDSCTRPTGLNANCIDVFVKDRQTGKTSRVSIGGGNIQGDGDSTHPAISASGRYIVFRSAATNLTQVNTQGKTNIFLKDTQTGALTLLSVMPGGGAADQDCDNPAISADGRLVAFSTPAKMTPDDKNGKDDVFLVDTSTGAITLVSNDASGKEGNDASGFSSVAISADGRFVGFDSGSSNLMPGQSNEKRNIFLKDIQTGALTLLSAAADGSAADGDSYSGLSFSANGTIAAFSSDADNLVPGDTNARRDIFVKNIQTGAIWLASADAGGKLGNGTSDDTAISSDGRFVAFDSDADNLVAGDTRGKSDVFLKEVGTGTISRISTSSSEESEGVYTTPGAGDNSTSNPLTGQSP